MRREAVASILREALRERWAAPGLEVSALTGERGSDDLREQPWLPVKYGRVGPDEWHGLVYASAELRRSPAAAAETLPLVVKVAPALGLAQTLIPWIIEGQKIALPRPYGAFDASGESTGTAPREYETYRVAETVPALRDAMPRWYGGGRGDDGEHVVFLERVDRLLLTDPGGEIAGWAPEQIDAALRTVAGIHAAFLGRNDWLAARRWLAPRSDTASFTGDADLWRGLIDDARRRQPAIVDERTWRRRRRLIDDIAGWHPAKDRMPSTLVHDDYNQRNVGFTPGPDGRPQRVVVFDWELTSVDGPQRDVVELLTFALSTDVDRGQVERHVATWRRALRTATEVSIDDGTLHAAFVAELRVEALNRVGMQLLFGAAFHLPYLARINATIEHLLDLYPK